MVENGHNLERRRYTTLVVGTVVALACGTTYAFSAYAPQLAQRLGLSHTRLNIIGLAGNIGAYAMGPILGRIVDRRGPRIIFASAFIMTIIGYGGMRIIYNSGDPARPIGTVGFSILAACYWAAATAGSAGSTGTMNANAKSWPNKQLGVVNGILLSGFGLSAFLFSTAARAFFKGDPSAMLLLLALGTAFPLAAGFLVVQPIPLTAEPQNVDYDTHVLLADHEMSTIGNGELEDDVRLDEYSISDGVASKVPNSAANVDVYGWNLVTSKDFWILSLILFLLGGTALMYFNNVGAIVQALLARDNATIDKQDSLHKQAAQVSYISLCSCLGRVLIGFNADFMRNYFGFPRSYGMTIVAIIFLFSQIVAYSIRDIDHLWMASMSVGLGYGTLYGLFPTIVIEWFGLPHYGENFGYSSIFNAMGGNLFSLVFGHNLDAHVPPFNEDNGHESRHQCLQGHTCYVDAIKFTALGCIAALCLAVYAGWLDRRKEREDPTSRRVVLR